MAIVYPDRLVLVVVVAVVVTVVPVVKPADLCTGNYFYGCAREAGGASGHILNPIQSARIRTSSSFFFKYGRVEVSARLPIGDWIWPAIWLLPRYNIYGQWPASGEIGNKLANLQEKTATAAAICGQRASRRRSS